VMFAPDSRHTLRLRSIAGGLSIRAASKETSGMKGRGGAE
jgi:hypothetical protein